LKERVAHAKTQTQTRIATYGLRLLLVAFFFVILFAALQPFKKRHQGNTVQDWIADWSQDRRNIRTEVIDAFGPDVVPELLSCVSQSQRRLNTLDAISPASFGNLRNSLRLKKQVAITWLALLHHRGHPVLPLALKSGQTNLVHNIYSYFDIPTIERALAKETDPNVRTQLELARASVTKHGENIITTIGH
jgi:hypothetical protein